MADSDEAPPPRRRFGLSSRQKHFIREVGSVVLGVLIALGIGEIAEAVRWRFRAENTLQLIHAELAVDAGIFQEREMIQPCIDRRLDAIRTVIREAQRSGRMPAIESIGAPPLRPMGTAAWEVAIGEGTTLHLPRGLSSQLAFLYAMVQRYERGVDDERESWSTLRALEDGAGSLSSDLAADLSTTLGQLRSRDHSNFIVAQQLLATVVRIGLSPDYSMVGGSGDGGPADLRRRVAQHPICKPLVVDGKPFAVGPAG